MKTSLPMTNLSVKPKILDGEITKRMIRIFYNNIISRI